MIFGKIEDLSFYKGISENLDIAIDYILSGEYKNKNIGKNSINDCIFFNIQECETKNIDDCIFEIHKKYIDIHIVIEGEENIGFSNLENLIPTMEFDAEKDYQFLKGEHTELFHMKNFNFLLFMPNEAHKTLIAPRENKFLKKAIFKIEM